MLWKWTTRCRSPCICRSRSTPGPSRLPLAFLKTQNSDSSWKISHQTCALCLYSSIYGWCWFLLMIKRFLMRTCSCTLEMITYASKTQKIEIAFKNWPINMYTDFRRLKTAKIEGGAYIAPLQAKSSTLFGRLYRVKKGLFFWLVEINYGNDCIILTLSLIIYFSKI